MSQHRARERLEELRAAGQSPVNHVRDLVQRLNRNPGDRAMRVERVTLEGVLGIVMQQNDIIQRYSKDRATTPTEPDAPTEQPVSDVAADPG